MPHVPANGIELFYEDFGSPDDPVVLLVMGLGTQLIAWPEPFVAALVAAGYRVIRFDNRDIGQSTHLHDAPFVSTFRAIVSARFGWRFPVAYTLTDMAADAIALLDALGVARAHVIGASMGGMIAQLMAADWPRRVRSLTSIMSSSGARDLPGPTPAVRRLMMRRPAGPLDRAAAVRLGVAMQIALGHPDPLRPANTYVELAGRSYDRGFNPLGARRQLLAILADGDRAARLARIAAPTLVIHGAADPLIPFAHAGVLVSHIPGARLARIEGMAHDLPPSRLDEVVTLVIGHLRAADALSRTTVAA